MWLDFRLTRKHEELLHGALYLQLLSGNAILPLALYRH